MFSDLNSAMRYTFHMGPYLRILILNRRNDGHNGPLGLRQNNTSQCSCAAKGLYESTRLVYRFAQRPNPSDPTFQRLSSYVESDDALIGSLTVKETLYFAAQLSLSGSVAAVERIRRINELLRAFGLTNQANTLIGTLLKKGVSTGQKRRLSVASQLISAPKILFLDEPTTGLDSAASFKVMSYVRQVADANKLIVIASIHQPSTATFELFDRLLLLSGGRTCFSGLVSEVKPYFESIGFAMPSQINPAEFILDLTNVDFDSDEQACQERIVQIQNSWASSPAALAEAF